MEGKEALTPNSLASLPTVTLTCVCLNRCPQQRRQPLIQHNALRHREPGQGQDQGEHWGPQGPVPHLEGGNDSLASVLEDILIRPARVIVGQLCSQVVVVSKPSDAYGLQEAVLIPPGIPQVCKSHQRHQRRMEAPMPSLPPLAQELGMFVVKSLAPLVEPQPPLPPALFPSLFLPVDVSKQGARAQSTEQGSSK